MMLFESMLNSSIEKCKELHYSKTNIESKLNIITSAVGEKMNNSEFAEQGYSEINLDEYPEFSISLLGNNRSMCVEIKENDDDIGLVRLKITIDHGEPFSIEISKNKVSALDDDKCIRLSKMLNKLVEAVS